MVKGKFTRGREVWKTTARWGFPHSALSCSSGIQSDFVFYFYFLVGIIPPAGFSPQWLRHLPLHLKCAVSAHTEVFAALTRFSTFLWVASLAKLLASWNVSPCHKDPGWGGWGRGEVTGEGTTGTLQDRESFPFHWSTVASLPPFLLV